jgi:hypothetical protein
MATQTPITLPWSYNFSTPGTLVETGSMSESSSGIWWVNSGYKMILANGIGQTIHGDLPSTDPGYQLYRNDISTDYGKRPQSIARYYVRQKFRDIDFSAYFRMDRYILSPAPERNAWNGLCLMLRDSGTGDTLMHAILRVDGDLVLKRKLNGTYTTLQTVKIFPGTWNYSSNPNLIPIGQWIGIKATTANEGSGVRIKICLDIGKTGVWKEYVSFLDSAQPILNEGYFGLRTDFSDVSFDDVAIVGPGTVTPPPPPPPPVTKTYEQGLAEGTAKGRKDMKAEALAAINNLI